MDRKEFRVLTQKKVLVLDGATGTELIKRGMPQGACPEDWVLRNPAAIADIQGSYRAAGSDIVYVPSFGGNRCKLEEFGLAGKVREINTGLAQLSRRAVGSGLVFGDLAPTGQFIQPFGDVSFEDAVTIFKEQVVALLAGGVDGFVIETMLDLQEARAALLAVRESCALPVLVTMTFDENQRTLTGNDPVSCLIALQATGADAFGCNCSTGPSAMEKIISGLKPFATIPLIAKPNAGMPRLTADGKTVFDMYPEEFGGHAAKLAAAGANLIGGCCGTTPEHIRATAAALSTLSPLCPRIAALGAVSSPRRYRLLGPDQPFAVIGERINPTGKKALQEELRAGRFSMVRDFATEQAAHGAAILDVNMGLSGIDEKAMMTEAVQALLQTVDLPLCIDSTDSEVIEAALRLYPGRALVNSISAEKSRLEKTLPIVAKYGAMFILLPLTDNGIPATLEERIEVVKTVLQEAAKYGYHREDIAVDGLVMTVSSDQKAPAVTLDLIEWATGKLGVNTVCGLSNVSFGMPERNWINNAFLGMAIGRGLNMAIINPSSDLLMATVAAGDALTGRDRKMVCYVKKYCSAPGTAASSAAAGRKQLSPEERVYQCVLSGDEDNISGAVRAALAGGAAPGEIVDKCLIAAINEVGERYDRKEYFLPQLILSADVMRTGFNLLEPLLESGKKAEKGNGLVILATVEGDIHDIGKNIVALMLKNYGFKVVDLGKDVSASAIIAAAQEHHADIVGLSALMTTTMVEMKKVIALAREKGLTGLKFMVGGAVVDQHYADEIGADGYAGDAMAAVRLAQRFTGSGADNGVN